MDAEQFGERRNTAKIIGPKIASAGLVLLAAVGAIIEFVANLMGLWVFGALGWIAILGCALAGIVVYSWKSVGQGRKTAVAAILLSAVMAGAAGIMISPSPPAQREMILRRDCVGVGELRSDPHFLKYLSCEQITLANAYFDLDDGAARTITDPNDERWDIQADATSLRVNRGLRIYRSKDPVASYVNCADQKVGDPVASLALTDLHALKIHSLCLITNGHHRAMLKIDGDQETLGPVTAHVVAGQGRLDFPG